MLSSWPLRIVLLVVAVSAIGWVGYTRLSAAPPKPELRTATVQRSSITQAVSVSGAVNPSSQVRLSFKSSGRLAEVFITVGQQVQVGDRVARLDDTDQRVSLDQALASLTSAQAKYAATLSGDEIAGLRLSVDNAQRSLDRLQTGYAAAKSSLEALYAIALGERGAVDQSFGGAQTTLTSLQSDLDATPEPKHTDTKSAITTGYTLYGNLQQAQVHFGVLDAAIGDVRKWTLALQDQIAKADAGRTDLGGYVVAQSSYGSAIARAQGAIDTVNTQLAAASSNATTIVLSLNTANTKSNTDLNLVRAEASTLAQQLALTQHQLGLLRSTLGSIPAQVSTITDVISGSAIVNAQNALATAKQSLQTKLNSRDTDLAAAAAAVQTAQSSVDAAQNALTNTVLLAPAAGVVSSLNSQVGEFVAASSTSNPFVVLSNVGGLVLHGTVGEADIARLRLGQVATITVDAIGADKRLTGKVTNLDPVAALQQGVPVYGVDIVLDLADAAIRPGMSGTANVVVASRRDVLVVPNIAIRNLGGRRGVQVLRDGGPADVTDVRFGITNEQVTEVASGLSEGEVVLLPAARAATPAIRFGPPGGPPGGGQPGR